MTVKLEGYPETYDVKFIANKDFKCKEEIDDFGDRFRSISPQLQDSECCSVKEGMIVCAACNAFGKDYMLFYDAVVEALLRAKFSMGEKISDVSIEIHKENHSFHNGVEECLCTFVLSWLHGPKKDYLASSGIEGICIIKGPAQVDPRIASFLKLANQKLRKSSCKSTSTSEQHNSASKGLSRTKRVRLLSSQQNPDSSFKATTDYNYSRHWDHDKDLGGQSSNYHLMLVENLERNLLPTSLRGFIHEHTSVWSHAYIFPSPSYMPYARGIIVVDCEEKLQKLNQFLDNPTHLVVSSKGRPMVISERDTRHSKIKTSLGSLVYRSQVPWNKFLSNFTIPTLPSMYLLFAFVASTSLVPR
ncbi:hypothetical protein RND71_037274 [Anisodus tanguticus]|uniref:SAWADEE domain-containing protein n=1 Tax=Anisodus tanguticus TaxID=243964 RepID=A0AAE1R2I6_9SOLA|nr:hypothetical protein RND71_037274 [Anisodus tanguticus]